MAFNTDSAVGWLRACSMEPAAKDCSACGKTDRKLLRCGRCRNAWFCNRACQILARRRGHVGANCCPADGAHTAEGALRLPDAAGPSTTESGAKSASLAPATNSCDACGKTDCKLLRCGRCRVAWFCNRDCQILTARQGHAGANCRPAGVVQPSSAAAVRPPVPAQSQPPTPTEGAELIRRFGDLFNEGENACMGNSRIGLLASVEKFKEAAAVADLIGGVEGAVRRADADQVISTALLRLGNMTAAALSSRSSLQWARASRSRTTIAKALVACGRVAMEAPGEMAKAEREAQEQERRSGSSTPPYGDLDLSQEGRISLPSSRAAISRLDRTYYEAAVALCDAALAAAGGRDSPAANNEHRVPLARTGAQARGVLGCCMYNAGEEPQRGLELMRQAVALCRYALRTATTGHLALGAKRFLATWLCNLGCLLWADHTIGRLGSNRMAEAESCLREALELSEETDDVGLKQNVLTNLANMPCLPTQPVGPAEAAALRGRLNTLYTQAGGNPDTSCTICLEPLEQSCAEKGAAGDDGHVTDPAVRVLRCGHQFHRACLSTWWRTASKTGCPICQGVSAFVER